MTNYNCNNRIVFCCTILLRVKHTFKHIFIHIIYAHVIFNVKNYAMLLTMLKAMYYIYRLYSRY